MTAPDSSQLWLQIIWLFVLALPIATIADGGCYDGLMSDRVNLNQGAESILAFQFACAAVARAASGADERSQSVRSGAR